MDLTQVDSIFDVGDSKINVGTLGEKGSGLGLVMVKEFADLNQISIEVKSELNIGTIFLLGFNTSDSN